jgi:demethylmenaquinone methyltransferase/2-methoxy-6-polyprenyl-1,4-benzoquinol methylase
MSFAYMRVLESAPKRYELGMSILTLGQLQRVRDEIAARLHSGDQVLDLGCGTGALAVQLALGGCQVRGVDISPAMLSEAKRRVREAGLEDEVWLKELGAVGLDAAFGDGSLDAVVSTLVFSELADEEITYALAECWRVLRPGGQLLIADEILPDSWLGRASTFLLRLPLAVIAFLLTQDTTHRVAGLRERIEGAGFRIASITDYLAGTLQLVVAVKE